MIGVYIMYTYRSLYVYLIYSGYIRIYCMILRVYTIKKKKKIGFSVCVISKQLKIGKMEQDRKDIDSDSSALVSWICKRIVLPGIPKDYEWNDLSRFVIRKFLENKRSLVLVAFQRDKKIHLHTRDSPQTSIPVGKFAYFVKLCPIEVHEENASELLQFGYISSSKLNSLYGAMTQIFIPLTVGQNEWPDNVRKDYARSLHKFMASLTEAVNYAQGKTVLYVPSSEEIVDVEKCAKDKDLVQRLEATVIFWTRQIKDVVNNHDIQSGGESQGPLDEISFWQDRTVDLTGISDQLNRPALGRILQVLQYAKSTYLQPFRKLSNMIHNVTSTAKENLKFLQVLKKPCQELTKAKPCDVPQMLPKIMHLIRMIWTVSKTYVLSLSLSCFYNIIIYSNKQTHTYIFTTDTTHKTS